MYTRHIVSHKADLDGLASAYFASKLNSAFVCVKVFFADYDESLQVVKEAAKGCDELWILDLSWKTTEIIDAVSGVKSVVIIDHHPSSEATFREWALRDNVRLVEGEDRRAARSYVATMAPLPFPKEYTCEEQDDDIEPSVCISFDGSGKYCTADLVCLLGTGEDWSRDEVMLRIATHSRDLWQGAGTPERELGDMLTSVITSYDVPSIFYLMESLGLKQFVCDGEKHPIVQAGIKKAEESYRASFELADATAFCTYIPLADGKTVPIYTAIAIGHTSDIAHHYLELDGAGLVLLIDASRRCVSLRMEQKTYEDLGFGVNKIASELFEGGGGHPLAAGGGLSLTRYTNIIRKNKENHTLFVEFVLSLIASGTEKS